MQRRFLYQRLPENGPSTTRRWYRLLITAFLVVALLVPVAPTQAQDSTPSEDLPFSIFLPLIGDGGTTADETAQAAPALKLKAGTFHPAVGDLPVLAAGLTAREVAPDQQGYYIVQFNGPITAADKAALTATGASVLAYLPDYAYKVRMSPNQAAQARQAANVTWVGLFHPAYKLSPTLIQNGLHAYRVRVEAGADGAAVATSLAAQGVEILKATDNYLLIAANSAQLVTVANVLDVAWIENFTLHQKHNEYGAGNIIGGNAANLSNYDGSTQIAAVADTGLGDGTPSGAHPDVAGRVVNIFNWTTGNARLCYRVRGDGAQDVDSGHGTHVALSVVGDGGANGEGKSAAPAAGLVFQAVEEYLDIYGACTSPTTPDGYYLIGIPDDLHDLFQQAYNAGARIHANSWGSNAAGDYTLDSANADDFIWDNPDMVVTFSAGNEGIDANGDGIVDNDSIGSPATAKNVITIGASENDRGGDYGCDSNLAYQSHDAYQPSTTCAGMGGQNLLGTYGQRWSADYPAEPLFSDLTAGNSEQMASFSSRGPTDDGRIKPDVVAPGTWVLSGYSSLYQEGYNDPLNNRSGAYQSDGWGMPMNEQYKYFGGTSMSNPIAAGAATVVRDFYEKAHGHNASAALTKATLINSAVDLLDENNDGVNNNAYPIPNVHEGWGRIDLANATDNSHTFVDEPTGLSTGGSATYQHNVATAGNPLKVTLVWSDFASTESAASNLVNNLNLVVTAPDGTTTYLGNVFSGGWSQSGGSADGVNNVENVYIESAAAGTWTVTVNGANVPQGPQPFALVIDDGEVEAVDLPPTVSIDSPNNGATVSGQVDFTAAANDDLGVTQVEFFINGTSIGVDSEAPYAAAWDSTATADGSYSVSAVATDTTGQTGSDSINITVANTPAVTMHVGDLDGSSVPGSRNRWSAVVTVTVHDSSELPVENATVNGSWGNGTNGSGSCTTDSSGQCQVTKNNLKGNVSSVTFTVTGVSHATNNYDAANHDPDGDSNGTTILVNQ